MKKSLYIKDADKQVFEKLQQRYPNKSFSEMVATILEEKLEDLNKEDGLTIAEKVDAIVEAQNIDRDYIEDQSDSYIEGRFESLQENLKNDRDRSNRRKGREDLEQLKTARKELYEGDGNLDEEVQKLVEDEDLSEAEALKRLRKNLYEGEGE